MRIDAVTKPYRDRPAGRVDECTLPMAGNRGTTTAKRMTRAFPIASALQETHHTHCQHGRRVVSTVAGAETNHKDKTYSQSYLITSSRCH